MEELISQNTPRKPKKVSKQKQDLKYKYKKFAQYLDFNYNENTAKQYLGAFKRSAHLLGSQTDIDMFLLDKVYNKSNNSFYKSFLRAFIECFELPYIIKKPRRRLPKIEKDYKFLTKEQVDRIINGTTPYISLLSRLYFETGLRLRELINVRRDDINLTERTLSGMGKGNKPFVVKFSYKSQGLLQEYMRDNSRELPFHCEYPIKDHAKSFWYYLRKECKERLSMKNVHPHRFRHALGHHLRVDKGFDQQQIRVKLRHADTRSTDIYTVATVQEVDDRMDEEVFEK